MDLAILIDFSNTITTKDSEDYSLKAFLDYISKKYGIKESIFDKFVSVRHIKLIERELNFRTFMEINVEILRSYLGVNIDSSDLEKYYEFHCMHLKLRKDFLEFVRYVNTAGLKMIMVTDADFEYTMRTLNALGILDKFDYIVTAEHVKKPKPNQEIFLRAMLLAKCPKTIFFIGDSERRDIEGASNMGMITIKMNNDSEISKAADYNVKNFSEAKEIINDYLIKLK